NNHVIQQFAATASHPAFGNPVLPRTAIGCSDQAATQAIEHLGNIPTKLFIPVQDQIFRRGFLGECFSQLLHDPLAGRMFGSVEMEDSPAVVADDEEAVEKAERSSGHREEIHRGDYLSMVLQERQPVFERVSPASHSSQITRN